MCMKPTLLSLAIASATLAQGAFAAEELSNLFTQGKPILDARYRFENVDQNNDLRDANAQTLRTRAGFQSGQWYGLSGLLEVDNVSRLGDDAYNSTRNGQKEYAVVADPDGTEVNQALLRYDHKLGSAVLGQLFDRFGWAACLTGVAISLLIAALLTARLTFTPSAGSRA